MILAMTGEEYMLTFSIRYICQQNILSGSKDETDWDTREASFKLEKS